MSSIHILRGLLFALLPSMNPSVMLTKKFRFGLPAMWPKNDDLRRAICSNRYGSSVTLSNISLLVILFIQLTFSILR